MCGELQKMASGRFDCSGTSGNKGQMLLCSGQALQSPSHQKPLHKELQPEPESQWSQPRHMEGPQCCCTWPSRCHPGEELPKKQEVPPKGLRAGMIAGSSFSFHMPGITPKAKLGADKCFPGYLERFISLLLSADSNIYIPFMRS